MLLYLWHVIYKPYCASIRMHTNTYIRILLDQILMIIGEPCITNDEPIGAQ